MPSLKQMLTLALLMAGCVAVAQPANGWMPPRTNVAAYDDENAIPKLAYRESPYFLELSGFWQRSDTDSSRVYSRQIDVEKVWKQFRVYLNVRCGRAVRVLLNGQEVGRADDSRAWNAFLLDGHLRYGKPNTLAIEALRQPTEALLESDGLPVGLNGDPYILFKNDPGIDDYTLTADYDAATGTGSLALDARLFNGKKKGKYYLEAEVWNPQGRTLDRMGRWVVFDKTADALVDFSRSWANVQPWSAEKPALYTLVLRLRDENMAEEEVVGTRFGFRRVEVKEGQLLVNGRAITLKGAIYSSFSAPKDSMRQTLTAMKRANVNAVRTAKHSPQDPCFYELCDQLGLYVVCDANLLPASSQRHAVATDKEYIPLFERRVENLHGIYKNYTSIIMWSLGDSRDNGVCMQAAYRRLKTLERQRPVVYSGANYSENTDLIALHFPKEQTLRQAVAKTGDRPLVMLASAGDSDFELFWSVVESSRQLQGGFFYWEPPRHVLSDIKGLYSPFDVRLIRQTLDEAEFMVYNRQDFSDLSAYRLEYTIFTNLRPNITAGDLAVGIAPGGVDKVKVTIPPATLQPGEELFVRFDLIPRSQQRQPAGAVDTKVFQLEEPRHRMVALPDGNTLPADTTPLPYSLYFLWHDDWTADTIGITHRRPDGGTLCRDYMLRYKTSEGTTVCDARITYTLFSTGDVVVDFAVSPIDRFWSADLHPAVRVRHGSDSMSWFGLDREVCFRDRHSGIPSMCTDAFSGLDLRQVRWCAAVRQGGGLFMQLLGQQFRLVNRGVPADAKVFEPAEAFLVPETSPLNFRLRLRPYHGIDPMTLHGYDFPRMDAGLLDPPTIEVSQQRFTAPLTVTLSSTAKGEIRYTLDGSEPDGSSPLYTRPITLTTTTVVKAKVFAKEVPPSFTATRKFSYDYIVATTFSRKPSTPYNVGADSILFDGVRGSVDDLTRDWIGFSGTGVTTTLRLSKPIDIDYVTLRYAHAPQLWAFAPRAVTLAFSSDGVTFGDTVSVELPFDPSEQSSEQPQVVELSVPARRQAAAYVRVLSEAIPSIPAWHRAKGLKPWLLMDEVTVVEK